MVCYNLKAHQVVGMFVAFEVSIWLVCTGVWVCAVYESERLTSTARTANDYGRGRKRSEPRWAVVKVGCWHWGPALCLSEGLLKTVGFLAWSAAPSTTCRSSNFGGSLRLCLLLLRIL